MTLGVFSGSMILWNFWIMLPFTTVLAHRVVIYSPVSKTPIARAAHCTKCAKPNFLNMLKLRSGNLSHWIQFPYHFMSPWLYAAVVCSVSLFTPPESLTAASLQPWVISRSLISVSSACAPRFSFVPGTCFSNTYAVWTLPYLSNSSSEIMQFQTCSTSWPYSVTSCKL